jgi:hypothetical protein
MSRQILFKKFQRVIKIRDGIYFTIISLKCKERLKQNSYSIYDQLVNFTLPIADNLIQSMIVSNKLFP